MAAWTCQRRAGGVKCGALNPPRTRKCRACGKPRPARRRAAHLRALDLTYEDYIAINGGEWCGICGAAPTVRRLLDRDHDHATGRPRGLLCWRHNLLLGRGDWTPELLRAAAAYLERAQGIR